MTDGPMGPAAPTRPAGPGGDEAVAELMAQHGAARYADVETIAACLGRPASPSSSEPGPGPGPGPDVDRRAPSLE